MKENINHKGWIKALLSFFLLFIPELLSVLVLLFFGYDITKISNINIDFIMAFYEVYC